MSILAQNHTDEVALLDCIQKFFAKHHVGKLLKQCNGTKEKGVPSISLLKYKLGNIFIGRSIKNKPKTKGSDNLDDYDYGEDDTDQEDEDPWETEESDEPDADGGSDEESEDKAD